jgi:hypothetical protein
LSITAQEGSPKNAQIDHKHCKTNQAQRNANATQPNANPDFDTSECDTIRFMFH